ncbi:hypothetical protein [Sutcliffiella sp. NC1]|uniref:hypothetical protein n=1 Tax=Sutcliffiella sp. NC1 TaxID=3004096 RepID=UPI0022DE8B3B|nr:hypothetical protein [Sutcliffiella sp. NC1]WBL15489.1 hypothetical protein O1A01_02215 [Sutcliffiella sp. NC1]
MGREKVLMKKKLDEELNDVTFTRQNQVLLKIEKKSFREKMDLLLNKDIEINIIPVSLAIMLIALPLSYGIVKNSNVSERKMIEIAGSYYWEDELEGRLKIDED